MCILHIATSWWQYRETRKATDKINDFETNLDFEFWDNVDFSYSAQWTVF
jgi:hypothetical protein